MLLTYNFWGINTSGNMIKSHGVIGDNHVLLYSDFSLAGSIVFPEKNSQSVPAHHRGRIIVNKMTWLIGLMTEMPNNRAIELMDMSNRFDYRARAACPWCYRLMELYTLWHSSCFNYYQSSCE